MRLHLRLFPRFLVLLVLLSVVPTAIVGWIVVGINNESLQKEVQRYHLGLADSMSEKFDERLAAIQSQMRMGVATIQNQSLSWPIKYAFLQNLLDSYERFAVISIVAPTGEELGKVYNPDIEKDPALVSHAGNPYYVEMKKTGRVAIDVKRLDNQTFAQLYLPFETPIGRNALFVKVSINDLAEDISSEMIGQTGFAYYVGKEGQLLSTPSQERTHGNPITKDQSVVKTALAGSLGAREFLDEFGVHWVGASAPVSKLGGAIITQQTRNEAYADSRRSTRMAFLIVVLMMIVATVAAALMARSLVRPLLTITNVAQSVDIASGQFPDPVNVNTRDEIQDLAQTFNSMLGKLKGYADLQVEKLIIEQKKTQAIIFSIEDGIIMTDYQGKIQLVNNRAKNILNMKESEDVLGTALWKYLPSPELKTALVEVLTKSDPILEISLLVDTQTVQVRPESSPTVSLIFKALSSLEA
jgi:HAMP domain-containing protein